jgi:hypothetical protein
VNVGNGDGIPTLGVNVGNGIGVIIDGGAVAVGGANAGAHAASMETRNAITILFFIMLLLYFCLK